MANVFKDFMEYIGEAKTKKKAGAYQEAKAKGHGNKDPGVQDAWEALEQEEKNKG
jgi:hypothetical protein